MGEENLQKTSTTWFIGNAGFLPVKNPSQTTHSNAAVVPGSSDCGGITSGSWSLDAGKAVTPGSHGSSLSGPHVIDFSLKYIY